jgi:hypothetical protein
MMPIQMGFEAQLIGKQIFYKAVPFCYSCLSGFVCSCFPGISITSGHVYRMDAPLSQNHFNASAVEIMGNMNRILRELKVLATLLTNEK